MLQMQTREKSDSKARSIGDICPTRAVTTLFFNTESIPTKVVDENQSLICFYAKQVMADHYSHRREDVKENKFRNMSTATESNKSGEINSGFSKREDYWYFFSPLYHGESPVACITLPRSQGGTGKIIPIYTFKRMYSGQTPANVAGYFGERIYSHGYFTQSEVGFYQLILYSSTAEERGDFFGYTSILNNDQPFFTGSSVKDIKDIKGKNFHHCISPKIFCVGCSSNDVGCTLEEESNEILQDGVVEFHRLAGENAANVVISIDETGNSMKLSEGVDLMEAILLWCAYSLFRGKSIGGA